MLLYVPSTKSTVYIQLHQSKAIMHSLGLLQCGVHVGLITGLARGAHLRLLCCYQLNLHL